MTTYEDLVDATLATATAAAGRPAAQDHHARRRGRRRRHRELELPQRHPARVGRRDGRADRRRAGGDLQPRCRTPTCSTGSPTPTGPWATRCGCGSSWSRSSRSCTCSTSGLLLGGGGRRGDAGADCRLRRRRLVLTRRGLRDPRDLRRPGTAGLGLHRHGDLLPVDPAASGEDWLTVRDYIWRWDTDWFWCSRALGVQNPRIAQVDPAALPALRRVVEAGRVRAQAPVEGRATTGAGGCRTART